MKKIHHVHKLLLRLKKTLFVLFNLSAIIYRLPISLKEIEFYRYRLELLEIIDLSLPF